MARLLPVVPVIGPDTYFQPVYVADVAAAAARAAQARRAGVYELGGPEVASFRELMERMLRIIRRRRLVVAIPIGLARFKAELPRRPAGAEPRALHQHHHHPRPDQAPGLRQCRRA